MKEVVENSDSTATDLANWLVQNLNYTFRDAYKKMGNDIAKQKYIPKKTLDHTHLGSLGNLALQEIDLKMKKAMG